MGAPIMRALGRSLMCPALCLLVSLGAAPARAFTVLVTDVVNDNGHVRVALCTPETFLGTDCPYKASAPARRGEVVVPLTGVPSGDYALQAFHDEDDDRTLDRSFFGLPEEGMAFGNDAAMQNGPPRFEDAVMAVDPDATARVRMQYFRDGSPAGGR